MRPWKNGAVKWLGMAAILAVLGISGCEGSGTQTTGLQEGEMGGILVDQDGRPVSEARVQIWLADAVSGMPDPKDDDPPEAITDKAGKYRITELPPGRYNVFGSHPRGLSSVLIPEVDLGKMGLDLGTDTMKAPGKVVGKTILGDGAPLEGVFCYLPGSSYISISDEDGTFSLNAVPEGRYRLKYAAAGYNTVTDTIEVTSGEILALTPQQIGPDLDAQPPIPQNLRAAYDTVRGAVTLRWKPVKLPDLGDYVLYLQEKEREPRLLGSLGKDSAFVDSSMRGLFLPGGRWEGRDTGTLVFMIKARDVEGNLSRLYSEPVALTLTRPLVYQVKYKVVPEGVGDTTACRDTLRIRLARDGKVEDTWAYAAEVSRKPDANTWEAVYRDKSGGAKAGDTLTFVWYYGKGQGDPNYKPNYPPREVFDKSYFEIQLLMVGPANWFQPYYVAVPVVDGCIRPEGAREIQ